MKGTEPAFLFMVEHGASLPSCGKNQGNLSCPNLAVGNDKL